MLLGDALQNNTITMAQTHTQLSDAEQLPIASNKQQTKVWTAKHYFNKQQRILAGGEQLTTAKLSTKINTLTALELQQCHARAERMKTMLANIEEEIASALRKTNGTIGWRAQLLVGLEDWKSSAYQL